jgi:cytochrome c553
VVEAEIVPKTSVAGWFLTEANSGESEPIGNRIIEVPEDLAQFENRDARARFIAYVPAGSIERGKGLVAEGVNGGGTQGAGCHGPGLIGGSGIAGVRRATPSASSSISSPARAGASSELMKPVVEKLTVEDMIALAACAASLPPDGGSAR